MRMFGLKLVAIGLCWCAATASTFATQTMAPYCQTGAGGCATVAFAAIGHPCGCVDHSRLHSYRMIKGVVVMRPYGFGLGY